MARLVLDTGVFIDHLRGRQRIRKRGHQISYSVITRAELYVGRNERETHELLEQFEEHSVDRTTAERAGRIRRETGINLPDALIAATALVHGLTLITRNVGDFRGVPKLRMRAEI